MHSSRMRTGRALTVSRGGGTCLVPGGGGVPAWSVGGGCLLWGVYLPGPGGGCLLREGGYLPGSGGGVPAWSRGVSAPGGGVPAWSRRGCLLQGGGCLVRYSPPPVNRMTDRCKNITLAKTSFRPVTNKS